MSRRIALFLFPVLMAGLVLVAAADTPPAKDVKDASKDAAKDPAKEPKDGPPKGPPKALTTKVEKGTLTNAVAFKGIVEGGIGSEVTMQPKNWMGPMVVARAIEHGTPVKAGDVLVEFETDKIDQLLKDIRQDRELAEISLKQAELDLAMLEKTTPLEMASAEREAKNAADDLNRFLDVDQALSKEAAQNQLKNSRFNLEYSKDELKQLMKMYKDKDLTEETEEMILKRQKNQVESAEFFLKQTTARIEQQLKTDLPRREQLVRDMATKTELALSKAREMLPLGLNQKRLSLAKAKYEQKKAADKFSDLEKDRASLSVKAATDGLAYYGRYNRGTWVLPLGGLRPGSIVMPGEGVMSVVTTEKLTVRGDVDEQYAVALKVGTAGKAKSPAFADKSFAGKMIKIGAAPLAGRFEVKFELADTTGGLLPGMTAGVKIVTAEKKDVATLPTAVVFTDDDDETRYVYLPAKDKDAKPTKKTIKVGLTVGEKVEIVEGLSVGDEVLSSKP